MLQGGAAGDDPPAPGQDHHVQLAHRQAAAAAPRALRHHQDGGDRPHPHAGGRGGARHNITVNAICPGGHPARDLELAKAFAEYRGLPFDGTTYTNYAPGPKPANKVLAGRWLQAEGYVQAPCIPEDAAAMAVFIASDEAASFTGQDVNTAAGFVMW